MKDVSVLKLLLKGQDHLVLVRVNINCAKFVGSIVKRLPTKSAVTEQNAKKENVRAKQQTGIKDCLGNGKCFTVEEVSLGGKGFAGPRVGGEGTETEVDRKTTETTQKECVKGTLLLMQ